MHQQPGDRNCANEAIGGDHWGPVQVYMAKVDDAASADGPSAGWFKVDEMGLASNNPDYWANQVLNVCISKLESLVALILTSNLF